MSFAHKNIKTIFIAVAAVIALFFAWAEVAMAQETETVAPTSVETATDVAEEEDIAAIAPAGVTPQSPLYAADRFFERAGLFFAFGREARARRLAAIAEERLSEARVLAEDGDLGAEALVEEYDETFEDATIEAELSGDESTEARLAEQAARHSAVLDRVIERVPEEVRERIQAARDRFVENHIAVLRNLAEKNPERAAEIFARVAERRDLAAERKAERQEAREEKADELRERFKESEKYTAFGEEISLIARKRGVGETKVDELVHRAAEHRIEVLERVRAKAPEAALQGLDTALSRTRSARAFKVEGLSPTQIEERLLERKENATERIEEGRVKRIDMINTRTDTQLEKRGDEERTTERLEEQRTNRIDTVNTRADTRIDRVDTRIDTRIDRIETRAENRTNATQQRALETRPQ